MLSCVTQGHFPTACASSVRLIYPFKPVLLAAVPGADLLVGEIGDVELEDEVGEDVEVVLSCHVGAAMCGIAMRPESMLGVCSPPAKVPGLRCRGNPAAEMEAEAGNAVEALESCTEGIRSFASEDMRGEARRSSQDFVVEQSLLLVACSARFNW